MSDQGTPSSRRDRRRRLRTERITELLGSPAAPEYPEHLPVAERREDILEALRKHQVVVIAGDTGSGKTTQIPKMLLELGRGTAGLIGHTQPRRIAARSVAERLAAELGTATGDLVGYSVRFTDEVSDGTAVKVMTDGILLAELRRDRLLRRYDTIIVDEAHERSLNIDFLLGYLKQLLPQRPDLTVVITSATIDVDRFAKHFAAKDGTPAPVIEVSGRTYPVEVRYRPVGDEDPLDALTTAVEECLREGRTRGGGDVLVFLSGEREIRDAADALSTAGPTRRLLSGIDVLPLYGRLSSAEQHRVFEKKNSSRPRVVLTTNVAETSLTVPGIHFVVDTGYARISRYSSRTKVQRLPTEPISQASARQRSGRCGRLADGVAIRLYSEEDFENRPEFTDPEVLRTSLAHVILHMADLGLGSVEEFPFLDAPDRKAIRDGLTRLTELEALRADGKLTRTGREIARLPVDPRMGRMLVEAHRRGVLTPVMVVVAGLALQDPRERPSDEQAKADALHTRFRDKTSDFLTLLNLWNYVRSQREALSGSAFRRLCRKEFLHWLRLQEWGDLVDQLHDVARDLGWIDGPRTRIGEVECADADAIHRSILSGLLSSLGLKDEDSREFRGVRGSKFLIFPGSALAKKPPAWVMANELVETSRLFARDVARIDPSWVEQQASHLVKRTYAEPQWSEKRGAAMARETVLLYGLPLVKDRLVTYSSIDPEVSRELFIRHALVWGEWKEHYDFWEHNQRLLEDVDELENKARRRDLVVDEETLVALYDERLPRDVVSVRHFAAWWKKQSRTDPQLLTFTPEMVAAAGATEVGAELFPDRWRQGDTDLDVTYRFDPSAEDDGVTVHVPVPMLPTLRSAGFDWLVPGLRQELILALLRGLPKHQRRLVVPLPDTARAVQERMTPRSAPLVEALAAELSAMTRQSFRAEDFDVDALPQHLRMRFAAVDKRGRVIDGDRNLAELRRRQSSAAASAVGSLARSVERGPASVWTTDSLGSIPEEVVLEVDGTRAPGYPTLVRESEGWSIRVKSMRAVATAALFQSQVEMLSEALPKVSSKAVRGVGRGAELSVARYAHGGAQGLLSDIRRCVVRDLLVLSRGPVRSPEAFEAVVAEAKEKFTSRVRSTALAAVPVVVARQEVELALGSASGGLATELREDLERISGAGFVFRHGSARLPHLVRYLTTMRVRWEKRRRDAATGQWVDGSAQAADALREMESLVEEAFAALPTALRSSKQARAVQWMVEEYRVSLFAQQVGTNGPVSSKRIRAAVEAL